MRAAKSVVGSFQWKYSGGSAPVNSAPIVVPCYLLATLTDRDRDKRVVQPARLRRSAYHLASETGTSRWEVGRAEGCFGEDRAEGVGRLHKYEANGQPPNGFVGRQLEASLPNSFDGTCPGHSPEPRSTSG